MSNPAGLRTTFKTLQRKFTNFRREPMGILGRKIAMSRSYRHVHDRVVLRFPLFDICRWYVNRVPRKLYLLEKSKIQTTANEQRILSDLERDGIALTSFQEVFPAEDFAQFQGIAEKLLAIPDIKSKIEEIKKGQNQKSVSGSKFYLVKPLGPTPLFDSTDDFLRLALSDEVLRIVCGYLGTFARLIHIEHWCNVATEGNDSFSQRWHRDPDDKKLVKLFLYIRDVDGDTGPFSFIPGSQNGGPHSRVYPQKTHESQYPPDGWVGKTFSGDQIRTCTGKAGTMILCNTSGFHKGGHPTKSLRLLFTCAYTSNAAKVRNDILYSVSNLDRLRDKLGAAGRFAVGHLA